MEPDFLNVILLKYDKSYAKVDLIRHNENITNFIDGKYMLRIHKVKAGG